MFVCFVYLFYTLSNSIPVILAGSFLAIFPGRTSTRLLTFAKNFRTFSEDQTHAIVVTGLEIITTKYHQPNNQNKQK